MLLEDEHWVGCPAARSKTGDDLSISRNFICPSPEDLAAHRRLDRKPPWHMPLSPSLLHDRRDISSRRWLAHCATTHARRSLCAFTTIVCPLLLHKTFVPCKLWEADKAMCKIYVFCDDRMPRMTRA